MAHHKPRLSACTQKKVISLSNTLTPQNTSVILALRNGEEWAFTSLVDHYCPGMVKFSMTITSDQAIAETIVLDVWQEILKRLAKFEGRSSFKAWIFRHLHMYISRLPIVSSTPPGMRAWQESPPHTAKGMANNQQQQPLDLQTLFTHDMTSLTVRQRQVLMLRDREQFESHDICFILNMDRQTYLTELQAARLAAQNTIARSSQYESQPSC